MDEFKTDVIYFLSKLHDVSDGMHISADIIMNISKILDNIRPAEEIKYKITDTKPHKYVHKLENKAKADVLQKFTTRIKNRESTLDEPINNEIQEITNEIQSLSDINEIIQIQEPPPPQIIHEKIQNEIIKIAYIRDCINIKAVQNYLHYDKKRYLFDNIYNVNVINENDNFYMSLLNFVNKRQINNIDSSLVLYGYSGSGKSTIMMKIIELIKPVHYRLYEIYCNEYYIYDNTTKTKNKVDSIDDEKYIFQSDNIQKVIENFRRVCATKFNNNSSRSHTVIELIYPSIEKACKLKIIDLCGSEKIQNSGLFSKKDQQYKETLYINQSLFSVSQIIQYKNKYHNNKCKLYNVLKNIDNIVFIMLFHDRPYINCGNHLKVFNNLFKVEKSKLKS